MMLTGKGRPSPNYKVRRTADGKWEVLDRRTYEVLETFDDPITAARWLRVRLLMFGGHDPWIE